jgi:uncharacterized protein YneF (UPF0154 family)
MSTLIVWIFVILSIAALVGAVYIGIYFAKASAKNRLEREKNDKS